MKDLDKLKKQYEKLGQEIERLEKRPKVRFKPDEGEDYWYTTRYSTEKPVILCSPWENDGVDNYNYKMGNCYRTEQEAQYAQDQQIAYVELIDAIADYNDGWWPECSKDEKYYFYLNTWIGENNLSVSKTIHIEHDLRLYFKDAYGHNHLIDKLGEDKIKLALGFDKCQVSCAK